MADAADFARDYAERLNQEALARHANRPRPVGFTHCEYADCREPIAPERTALGARLCVDCEEDERLRRAQFAGQGW